MPKLLPFSHCYHVVRLLLSNNPGKRYSRIEGLFCLSRKHHKSTGRYEKSFTINFPDDTLFAFNIASFLLSKTAAFPYNESSDEPGYRTFKLFQLRYEMRNQTTIYSCLLSNYVDRALADIQQMSCSLVRQRWM